MSESGENCQFCGKERFKYVCPKCNAIYCSVGCYKSEAHLACSEEFYKRCVQEEMAAAEDDSPEDVKKMYDILQRLRAADAGFAVEDFDNSSLDSDDDPPLDSINVDGNEDEEDEEDMVTRLQGVNLNDADEVWKRLTPAERDEFHQMFQTGEINKLIPDYRPWWYVRKNHKIVEVTNNHGTKQSSTIPEILPTIPKFSDICKKSPSPCIHYNLWNIVAAYTCVVRFFSGEHLSNPNEAVAHLVNLSTNLKYGTNFEDAEDAIVSVQMEAITTLNGGIVGQSAETKNPYGEPLLVESLEQLQRDARQVMITSDNKLAALSDMLHLLGLARRAMKANKEQQTEFHQIFAISAGSISIDKKKLLQISKRIEFLLSYVKRDEYCM